MRYFNDICNSKVRHVLEGKAGAISIVEEGKEDFQLTIHSYKPLFARDPEKKCDLLSGGKCYCDGRGIYLEMSISDIFNALLDAYEMYLD